MGLPANLDISSDRAVTDLRQYMNSGLVFSDHKFRSEITTVEVVIPSGLEHKLLLTTTRSLYQAGIHLILRPPLGIATSIPCEGG